jgi:anaerobic magnesium-protoporphyrin IX monomethyl ester cyclase
MFLMDWPITRDLINEIREHFPTTPIIAGGKHITACTEYVLNKCPAIDICVLGEREVVFFVT